MPTVQERAKAAANEMWRDEAIKQHETAISCLFMYLYNVAPFKIAEAVYGESHAGGYLQSKADEIAANPVRWYGSLDLSSRKALATAVVDRYADSGYLSR